MNSIVDVFCKGRKTPLLIGSVKSNMGHSEPASAMCSIAKVLIAMENGIIPQNIHFKTPNKDIPGLSDGRLRVVDKNMPWKGGLAAINSFGFGGANGHVLLRSNPKPKIPSVVEKYPRLIGISGRTEEGVVNFLKKLEEKPIDNDLIGLVHEIHKIPVTGHTYRGYTVLNEEKVVHEVQKFNSEPRPIWYVFSGMGSQWVGMAKDLMGIPVFEKSIRRCAEALRGVGMDLLNILINGTDETFDNVINSFVSIAAMQVSCTCSIYLFI